MAPTKELEGESWGKAFSPDASYAVRLIDSFLGQLPNVYELSGIIREERAWSLMQCGRIDESLDQALKIEKLRERNAQYCCNLARLYSFRNETNLAMIWLEKAIRSCGFSDIQELKRWPDLAAVRNGNGRKFNDLTKVLISYATKPVGSGVGTRYQNLSITNRSAFALTHVTVKAKVLTSKGEVTTITWPKFIDRIEPDEEIPLKNFFKDLTLLDIKPTVECDQNRKR
jgi:hypothetical protein